MADTLDWDALNLIDQINQDDDLTAEYINPLNLLNINNNYHDTDQITKEFNKNQLNIIHLNIHSLADKFDKLKLFLSNFTNKPDIILLCETFLNDKNKDLYNMDDYSFIEKHRTIKLCGGVGIYIKNDINHKMLDEISTFKEGEFESL